MNDKDQTADIIKTLNAEDPGVNTSVLEHFKPIWGRDPFRSWSPTMFRWRRRDDDDDDPPPCPAVIAPLPRFPQFGAEAELEAA